MTEALPQRDESIRRDLNVRTVFAGLMLGMFLGAINQTIVAPAMPRIVSDLGGMNHYSWIAVSSLLAATVAVPIVGKLSDLFGRKSFYVGGIVVFMLSSLVAGLAPNLEVFLVARVLEGLGMGTMMPLSQAIIGDIVSPRDRGKYQGLMGAVFGLASVIGPFTGGWITDALGWRWLFFANLPLALVALGFIIPFMRLPPGRRVQRIDYAGFVSLAVGLSMLLVAITLGGSEWAWSSPPILGLIGVGAAVMVLFVWIETRASEPVLPLRLWRNSIFTWTNLAVLGVAMAMFGAIYYIPVFVQGVLGASVTDSGLVLMPMMLSIVVISTLTGLIVSRTGRYKLPVVVGVSSIAIGYYLLSQMGRDTSHAAVVRNMILIGVGLGASMQTFVLIVQNAVGRDDLGVATATTQLFRSLGASVGTAVLGTILARGMNRHLEAAEFQQVGAVPAGGAEMGAGAVLDPTSLAHLSPEAMEAIRTALAESLQPVFATGLGFVAFAMVAVLAIREIPLRRTIGSQASEVGKELLVEMNQAGPEDAAPVMGQMRPEYRDRAMFLGVLYARLAGEAAQGANPILRQLVQRIGQGDADAGAERLRAVARALLRECDEEAVAERGAEAEAGSASEHVSTLPATTREVLEECPCDLDPVAALERVMAQRPAELPERLKALADAEERLKPSALLTPADLEALERAGVILSTALLERREG